MLAKSVDQSGLETSSRGDVKMALYTADWSPLGRDVYYRYSILHLINFITDLFLSAYDN